MQKRGLEGPSALSALEHDVSRLGSQPVPRLKILVPSVASAMNMGCLESLMQACCVVTDFSSYYWLASHGCRP